MIWIFEVLNTGWEGVITLKNVKKKITLHKIRAEESLFLVGVYNGEQRHWIVDS